MLRCPYLIGSSDSAKILLVHKAGQIGQDLAGMDRESSFAMLIAALVRPNRNQALADLSVAGEGHLIVFSV
ncbi:hypothetical protein AWM70_14465 [Paenibacillus yonginensis]|uniref:Uncharacterized protein n=1 Tax=Paenibacillus yonginensis TaxID=1462996 RepID=A0A1B1N2J2_9BACL|nr:hypothetical protein AWM70_14465 [Paenibacillus yonginensis]